MKALFIAHNVGENSGWGRLAKFIVEGVRARGIETGVFADGTDSVMKFLANILAVRRLAREYDIVHALDGWPYGAYGYFAVLGTRKRLFINGVGTYSLPGRSFPKKVLLRLAYGRARKIFCISGYTKTLIDKFYPSKGKTTVIHLGATPMPPARAFPLPPGSPVFLTVGAIKNRKGQKDSLGALALLKKDYPNFVYMMVGSDADRAYLKQIESFAKAEGLESNIQILPHIDADEELSYAYQHADVFLLNSRNDKGHFEGFGLVFLEAYQFGVPGVGSRDCGIEDAIVDGETGYLANQGDREDIARKIQRALENKEFLGEKAKKSATAFSWEKTVEAYIGFYKAER